MNRDIGAYDLFAVQRSTFSDERSKPRLMTLSDMDAGSDSDSDSEDKPERSMGSISFCADFSSLEQGQALSLSNHPNYRAEIFRIANARNSQRGRMRLNAAAILQ